MMKFVTKNVNAEPEPQNVDDVGMGNFDDVGMNNFDEVLLGENDPLLNHPKANVLETLFNIIKLFMGISILAGPEAYSESGLIGGIVGVTIAGALNIATVTMQAKAASRVDGSIRSYSELGRRVYGLKGKLAIDMFIIMVQSGLWVSYLIFNGVQVNQIVCLVTSGEVCNNKIAFIWMAVLFLIPLCWIKHMKHLAYVSVLFLIGMLFTYVWIIIIWTKLLYVGEGRFHEVKFFDPINYPFFFGIALLNFEGNPTWLNIRAAMKEPKHFNLTFLVGAIFVWLFAISVGSMGYSTFGSIIDDIVLINLPHGVLTLIMRLTYWVCLLGTYPIQMFAAIDIIENYTYYRRLPNIESFDLTYYIVRTLFVIWTALVAIVVPKFGLFLNFIGAFCGTALWFIIPVLIYEKVFKGEISIPQKILNITILVIGFAFGGISTIFSLIALVVALINQ